MKKRIVMASMMLSVALLAGGCSASTESEGTEDAEVVSEQVEQKGASNDYIKISVYKGVEVPAVEGLPEITEDAIDNNIQVVREGFAENTEVDRAIQDGDIVVIDYTTYINGDEPVESGSDEDRQLTVGNNSLFDGFDENLIGKSKGDSFQLENTFSESYEDEALAGQDAILKITIKGVYEQELPDLTDEFVQTISQESETVAEYREEMRALLEANNEEYMMSELIETAWSQVLVNTEVIEYPEDQLEAARQEFYDYYQLGADMYEMEFEEFLIEQGFGSEEAFEEAVENAARTNLLQDLVVALIVEEEGLELSDEDYTAKLEALAEEMHYDSVDAMIEDATEDAVYKYVMRDVVKEWLAENCVQVEDLETEETTETTEE